MRLHITAHDLSIIHNHQTSHAPPPVSAPLSHQSLSAHDSIASGQYGEVRQLPVSISAHAHKTLATGRYRTSLTIAGRNWVSELIK